MKPMLRFETIRIKTAPLGEPSSIPDVAGKGALQNELEFDLGEADEIHAGYGRRANSFPYPQYTCYTRKLEEREVEAAVLENDFLRAVFLPEFGGRLWELTDKERQENLLYTNDVIRFSNLAVCNAWFSGGVEWNMGLIGHTPFTARPLYTAVLEREDGVLVLRMYEYERVRGAEYQMDFWLEETDRFLNCRMRIANTGEETIPMYWWSNIAVPEYREGRVIVPASSAYTCDYRTVKKVPIPEVDGVDVTRYGQIPSQVDYFFDVPEECPKYIAHVNREGYGLLQYSTARLAGRKLFSWGRKPGGDRWQEFLTDQAGRYLEIQAGLAKTQYGCLPMPPGAVWEWLERYGSIQLSGEETELSFPALRDRLTRQMEHKICAEQLEERLDRTAKLAVRKGELRSVGSGFGALEAEARRLAGKPGLSAHLEYRFVDSRLSSLAEFLKGDRLEQPDPGKRPGYVPFGAFLRERLEEAVTGREKENWYAHYHLGLLYLEEQALFPAEEALKRSVKLAENPWAAHGLAAVCIREGRREEAVSWLVRGIRQRARDLSYVKEGFRLLLSLEACKEVRDLYETLEEDLQRESRLQYDYYAALGGLGAWREVYEFLDGNREFVLEDLRECEDSIADLWRGACRNVTGEDIGETPAQWDFDSL